MKSYYPIFIPFLILCCSTCKAQTASSSIKNSNSVQYTISNGSGFNIKNNGTLVYDGPLNSLSKPIKTPPSATLGVNNAEYSPPDDLINSTINENTELNILSQDLTKSTIPGSTQSRRISLAYTITVPSVLNIKHSESIQSSEVVDGQSLSIFSSSFPSSF